MFGTFVLGSNTDHFIIENLFKVQKNIGVSQSKPKVIDFINKRKPLRVKLCNWFLDKKNRNLEKKA